MRKAMKVMGFSDDEQRRVLKIVAAVLHIGNLRFRGERELGSSKQLPSVFWS
jgi:myosin heavy subunit